MLWHIRFHICTGVLALCWMLIGHRPFTQNMSLSREESAPTKNPGSLIFQLLNIAFETGIYIWWEIPVYADWKNRRLDSRTGRVWLQQTCSWQPELGG
jgi:hypothetical protein